ncbi:MAG: ribonuclease P protein component [Thermoanaerobaculia bacterium]
MADRRAWAPEGETLPRRERLRRRADYLRSYRRGRKRRGAHLILYAHPNELGHPRLGITASRKVGKAVIRNRIKRRVREIYRRWSERSQLPPLDLVVHVLPSARTASFEQLAAELSDLMGRWLPRPRADG